MAALKIELEVPRIQIGLFNMGNALTGLDAALRPHLDGEAVESAASTTYPLAINDGVGISVPFTLPMLGQQEVTLDHQGGLLWLGVPSLARSYVEPKVAHRTHGPIQHTGGMARFPLRLAPGDALSIPLGPVGTLTIRVRQ